MANDKIKDEEEMTSDELLLKDLGKSIYDVFAKIESLEIDLNTVSVPDVGFYREKVIESRKHATTVRKEVSAVLRAKTYAQSRLTHRLTRWEIEMDDKLEHDDTVRAGTSIEDRKARAANSMISLKNAISASKNEVEALKNLKQALDVTLRDFNSQCSDFKEQAKLVSENEPYQRQLPPNGTASIPGLAQEGKTFEQHTEEIREKYRVVDEIDEEYEECEESEEEDSEQALLNDMLESFKKSDSETSSAHVSASVDRSLVTAPVVEEELSLTLIDDKISEAPAPIGFTLPGDVDEEDTYPNPVVSQTPAPKPASVGFNFEVPEIDDPEAVAFIAKSTTFSVPEVVAPEPTLAFNDVRVEDSEDGEFESSEEDDFYSTGLVFLDDDAVPENSVTLEVDTSAEDETERDLSGVGLVLEDTAFPESPSFEVDEVVTTPPKISKHFAEDVRPVEVVVEAVTPAPADEPVTLEAVRSETANKPPAVTEDIDDLLSALGVF